jgi:hypothetical protein
MKYLFKLNNKAIITVVLLSLSLGVFAGFPNNRTKKPLQSVISEKTTENFFTTEKDESSLGNGGLRDGIDIEGGEEGDEFKPNSPVSDALFILIGLSLIYGSITYNKRRQSMLSKIHNT